ncbi:hypothetical protein EI94DRAFT_1723618 [Lactarius quietus]|nr:hypothetical protein EI94DRAFT_1757040 [Lactarius quietus]KAF8270006.1 hypothetical protein EI94DRAFT_1723618 [Lactarius quietus]
MQQGDSQAGRHMVEPSTRRSCIRQRPSLAVGQTRDVHIYKLTIENTVEQRILTLQEGKRVLATAALSGGRIKNLKLGLEDLMALFRPGEGYR